MVESVAKLDQAVCWQAVCDRESDADGSFYYGVRTTGVYCRPSCSARLPKRENVEFFVSCEEAVARGYRACKKCRPTEFSKEQYLKEKIVAACRLIEGSDQHIPLAELAGQVGLSQYHFHRLFKKYLGVTPKQYSSRLQAARFQNSVQSLDSITEAIYEAGFNSSSSAYSKSSKHFGMQPKTLKKGGEGLVIHYGIGQCYLGWLVVAATEKGVCAIEFADSPEELPALLQARFPQATLMAGEGDFAALVEAVVQQIEEPGEAEHIPLDIQGTAFQLKVWEMLGGIGYGETMTYSEVAERMGKPKAARAVASAIAENKLAVLIPCHRVVGKDGRLAGYRWGIERKRQLLEKERKKDS